MIAKENQIVLNVLWHIGLTKISRGKAIWAVAACNIGEDTQETNKFNHIWWGGDLDSGNLAVWASCTDTSAEITSCNYGGNPVTVNPSCDSGQLSGITLVWQRSPTLTISIDTRNNTAIASIDSTGVNPSSCSTPSQIDIEPMKNT